MFGTVVDLEFVFSEIEKDALFYKNSGGGVTFGGGEPMLYPEFLDAIASRCRSEDIPVAIETCGLVPWRNFEQILNKVDLVMFDIKHMDPLKHSEFCGHSNQSILKNLERLSQRSDVEIVIRVPIIPGLNDSEDNIEKTIKFVASLKGNIRGIDLLPYHKFGESKYSRLERKYALADLKIPSDEHMQKIKSMMKGFGIDIRVGG
jgi:pyruvate formate lyase activating enzyme